MSSRISIPDTKGKRADMFKNTPLRDMLVSLRPTIIYRTAGIRQEPPANSTHVVEDDRLSPIN